MGTVARIGREAALRWRRHAQGLAVGGTAGALLDLGVQDTGGDGSAWALAVRGVDVADLDAALVWTLRGAPHLHRREDLGAVAVATAPFSEADAAKRVFDAAKPLRAAGIPVLEALRTTADVLRELAAEPIVKGHASGRLAQRLPRPYLRDCRPCQATHAHEQTFRLASLQGGLELEPGTSPPVLRRAPGLEPNRLQRLGGEAEPRFDVVRGYLRCCGPARVADVAGFLDAPQREVQSRWPADAVPVEVEGERRWALPEDLELLADPPTAPPAEVRLLAPFDPWLQVRDRELLVPDPARRSALWRTLGRPGAVLAGAEVVGTWRPRQAKGALGLEVDLWSPLRPAARAALLVEAERLAAHRGVRAGAVTGVG